MRILLVLYFGLAYFFSDAQLLVRADVPKFLRTGDQIEIPVEVFNGTENEMKGQVQFLLFNGTTNTSVDGWMQNVFPVQHFSASSKELQTLNFPITVPMEISFQQLKYYAVINNDTVSLGESSLIPSLHAVTNSDIHLRLYRMRSEELIAIEQDTDVFTGDTIIAKGRVVTAKNIYPRSVQIEPAANMTSSGDEKTFRKMNVLVFEQRFIVTHAGNCSGIISASTSGVQKPNATSYILHSKSK